MPVLVERSAPTKYIGCDTIHRSSRLSMPSKTFPTPYTLRNARFGPAMTTTSATAIERELTSLLGPDNVLGGDTRASSE